MPAGIGERGRNAPVQDADFAKQPDLPVVHWMVGRVRAGEMAHQQREAVVFGMDARRDRDRFLGAHPEAVHAGIDVQRRAAAPAACRR